MGTSWSTIRERLLRDLDDYISGATSTNITGSDTVVLSSDLIYVGSGKLATKWLTILDGNNAGVSRVIQTHSTSSGEASLTLYGANLAAESGSVNFIVSSRKPADLQHFLNRAIVDIWPKLYIPRTEYVLAGSWGPDPLFRDWSSSSALKWWAATNATISVETNGGLIAKDAVDIEPSGAAMLEMFSGGNAKQFKPLVLLVGQTVNIYIHVKCDTAAKAKVGVSTDGGSTYSYGDLNAGTDWEWIQVTATLADPLIENWQVGLSVDSAVSHCYVDCYRIAGPYQTAGYQLPESVARERPPQIWALGTEYDDRPGSRVSRVMNYDLVDDGRTGTKLLVLPDYVWSLGWLEVVGRGQLSTVSADTDEVEVDGNQLSLLCAETLRQYSLGKGYMPAAEDIGRYSSEAKKWFDEVTAMLKDPSYLSPPMYATRRT